MQLLESVSKSQVPVPQQNQLASRHALMRWQRGYTWTYKCNGQPGGSSSLIQPTIWWESPSHDEMQLFLAPYAQGYCCFRTYEYPLTQQTFCNRGRRNSVTTCRWRVCSELVVQQFTQVGMLILQSEVLHQNPSYYYVKCSCNSEAFGWWGRQPKYNNPGFCPRVGVGLLSLLNSLHSETQTAGLLPSKASPVP